MAFSNRVMKPKRNNKPHIKFIDGYWRVSMFRKLTDSPYYWNMAYRWVNNANHKQRYNELLVEALING